MPILAAKSLNYDERLYHCAVERLRRDPFRNDIYYEYDSIQTNIYFEGVTKSVVACFETENEAATLYGKKVFELKKPEVIQLMKDNGFKELEEETEDGELRVSYEDAMIDFFFTEDKMTAVSWGVLVDEQGDII